MGWKSSVYITREDAVQLLLNFIIRANNEDLCDTLDELGEKSDSGFFGYNAMIVSDYSDLNESNHYMHFKGNN